MAWVTLDVGIDTFRPVQVEDPAEHPIHGETCEVDAATAEAVAKCTGRLIAVGTTSVRTLESFATGRRQLRTGRQDTRLFIRPGYEFKIIDGMFTNFHMPRTTMLMMISALAGRPAVMTAYQEALTHGYRFLSFGDSMLIA
jgi:S-adenosylmethionine:tRNA ribosyltransferase-isomerase